MSRKRISCEGFRLKSQQDTSRSEELRPLVPHVASEEVRRPSCREVCVGACFVFLVSWEITSSTRVLAIEIFFISYASCLSLALVEGGQRMRACDAPRLVPLALREAGESVCRTRHLRASLSTSHPVDTRKAVSRSVGRALQHLHTPPLGGGEGGEERKRRRKRPSCAMLGSTT